MNTHPWRKILSYMNEWVKIYRIWGVGSNAAMIKLDTLVAVGIRVILGQDWHINYWDLFSSVLQLVFIQGEIGNSGSAGQHYRRAHRVDGMPEDVHSKSWQHIDSVVRFSGKGADRRGDAGVERKRGKKRGRKRREGQSLKSSVRSGWGHVTAVAVTQALSEKGLLSCHLHPESAANLKLPHCYYLPSSLE